MTVERDGCQTCGGFGSSHDPISHGTNSEPGWALQPDGWPARECDHDNGECHDVEHQR